MIARIWRGITPAAKADAYFIYLQATGLKEYCSIEGNRGVQVLRRIEGERAEFLLISFWDSYDAIRKFAGDDFETAVYYPEDKDFLLVMEPKVMHYEILER
jgi:heme-degrading monooxygenase HmoA